MATATVEKVEHLFEVRNLGKDYQSGETTVQAIRNMDFHIDDGEFVSIMGQSGSGKSTLLSIIGAIMKPSSGRVEVNGSNIASLSDFYLSAYFKFNDIIVIKTK